MRKSLFLAAFVFCALHGWSQTPNGTIDFGSPVDATTLTTGSQTTYWTRTGTGGGSIALRNAGQEIGVIGEIEGTAPTSTSVNSIGITSAEFGTASTTFTVSFEVYLSGGASGTWHFFAGSGADYNSAQTAQFTGTQSFTGLRWTFGASNTIVTNNRAGAAWNATGITGTPFAQNTSYTVTIVGNNSASTVNYGTGQSVASSTYDLWVNGSLVGDDLAKALLATSTTINGFRFWGASSTGNVAKINLDNIKWWNSCVAPSVSAYAAFTNIPVGNYTDVTVNSANATLAGAVSVNRELIVRDNLTLTTGGNLTLKSTSTETARVNAFVGTANIAGNVTVERFIPTVKRAWRLVSSPVSGTTINAAWQEGGSNNTDPNPGYGTHITGGVIGDGYDLSSTNAASLKTWTQGTNSWTNYTAATTAGDITDHKGYILFIRGHRGLNITGTQPAATTTTLRATGTLRQGDMAVYVTTGAASTDYTIMGNPYASPIDLGLLNADHATIETFYSWDPNLAGTNGVGGYVLIQKNGANWDYTPQAGSLQTNNNARFLPSGAAIFIKSPGSAVAITMKESYKVADNTNLTYFRTGNAPANIAVNLNNSASATIDGIRVKFDDSYSNMVTAEDANKLNNEGENIAIRRNGMSLIVEKRQPVTQDDTLFIRLSGMQQNTAYELKFFPSDFTGVNAFVEDAYLNTSTPLSLTGVTTLNFSTDANVASVGDRFRLVFRPSSVLPVTFTAIRAQEKNGDVQLQWDVTNEVNTLSYVVERSKDGRTFNTVATVAATAMAAGEKHYQWLDMNAAKGANFYRVKSVQNSNESKYTSVVKVTLGDVMGDINIYPNPVKNGRLSVQLNDLAEGAYEMRILNASGQVIMNRKLQHGGGSSVEEISLPAGSAKGIYRLQMLGTDSRITKTIVVE